MLGTEVLVRLGPGMQAGVYTVLGFSASRFRFFSYCNIHLVREGGIEARPYRATGNQEHEEFLLIEEAKQPGSFSLQNLSQIAHKLFSLHHVLWPSGRASQVAGDGSQIRIGPEAGHDQLSTGRQHPHKLAQGEQGVLEIPDDQIADNPIELIVAERKGPIQIDEAQRGSDGRTRHGVGRKLSREFICRVAQVASRDRKSTRLNSSHLGISYAV